MTNYDVIVVGGGPAGSTAARECATAGLRVALCDKASFPRDKPCGGGVTIRCVRLLPFGLEPVSERRITAVRFTAPGATVTQNNSSVLTFLTQRRNLDAFLLQHAQAAGVTLLERAAVTEVARKDSEFAIVAGQTRLRSRYLIAADGANGVTARLAGAPADRWQGIALEGNLNANPMPKAWRDTIGVDFSHIRGGYGWLFPKADHVNIGLGGWRGSGKSLRSRLDRLVCRYGFDPAGMWNLRGHPVPVRRPGSTIAGQGLFLVGDAAGFLDPFTGEGIYAAIWSGRAAALRIVDAGRGDLEDPAAAYVEDVRTDLLPDLRVSRKLADLFHVAPWLWTQGIRTDRIWATASSLLTGEQTYAGASRAAGWKSSALALVYESLKSVSKSLPEGEPYRPFAFAS